MLAICVYVSRKGRNAPAQGKTYEQLDRLFSHVPNGDNVILLCDFKMPAYRLWTLWCEKETGGGTGSATSSTWKSTGPLDGEMQ